MRNITTKKMSVKLFKEKSDEFRCFHCAECCKMEGYVFLNKKELKEIAGFLNIKEELFKNNYIIKEGSRLRLNNEYNEGCIFLCDNKCRIYLKRPRQCVTFPGWFENYRYEDSLKESTSYCKGLKELLKGE